MACELHEVELYEVCWDQEDSGMNTQGQRKCAYARCKCIVGTKEKYCSDYCADADDVHEDEIQCDCKHAPCALG